MLSDDTIDNLAEQIVQRQRNINIYVIKKLAKRLNEIGELLPSDVYMLERLLKTGADVREINKKLAELTALQVAEIKKLIKNVAENVYNDTKPYYDYRKMPFIPFSQNKPLQRVVKAVQEHTAGTYTNLAKAQAFLLRNLSDRTKFIPTPLAKAYQSVIDTAVQATQSGTIDYNTMIKESLDALTEKGIQSVTYEAESGRVHSQRLDTAVRRNVLDGVREINQAVQDEVGKQFKADGKEITVHRYPAPDHADVQGHQLTNAEYDKMQAGEDFIDVNGRRYQGFKRAIGTLNCRHFAYSIIIGVFEPNYTEKELQDILAENKKGYTLPNGKNLTMYECTQKQREYELLIRKAREKQIAAKTAGDIELAKSYDAKIADYVKEYQQFSKGCGLSVKGEKTRVKGYKEVIER